MVIYPELRRLVVEGGDRAEILRFGNNGNTHEPIAGLGVSSEGRAATCLCSGCLRCRVGIEAIPGLATAASLRNFRQETEMNFEVAVAA